MVTVPCEQCGAPRSGNTSYRPKDNRSLCAKCRGRGRQKITRTLVPCPQCGRMFDDRRTTTCSLQCGNLRRAGVAPGDPHKSPRNLRRRALEASRPGLDRRQREELLRTWVGDRSRCLYCGDLATTIDHRMPLHLGGTNELDNLVPACRPCNTSKGRKTVEEWGGRRGRRLRDVRHPFPG